MPVTQYVCLQILERNQILKGEYVIEQWKTIGGDWDFNLMLEWQQEYEYEAGIPSRLRPL